MAQQHLPFELCRVFVPELGCLAVEWGRAIQNISKSKHGHRRSLFPLDLHRRAQALHEAKRDGKRSILVRFPQQTLQTNQHGLDVHDGAPLLFQDVQTYSPREIHVGMVDGCFEQHCWWGIGVVGWELEAEFEREVFVWRIGGAGYGGCPVEKAGWGGEGAEAGSGREH